MKKKKQLDNSDNFYELEMNYAFPSYGTSGCINWDSHKGKPEMIVGSVKYLINKRFPEFHWIIEVNHPYLKEAA